MASVFASVCSLLLSGVVVAQGLSAAVAEECKTPDLLRGKATSLAKLMPKVQPPKGEFETSEEYATRSAVRPPESPLLVSLEAGSGEFTYDADAQRFTWKRQEGFSGEYMISNMISVHSDLFKAIRGEWKESTSFTEAYLRRSLSIEEKETLPGARYAESRIGLVLYSNATSLPKSISSVEIERDKAVAVKKGLRAVALIEPEAPYFVRGHGSTAGVSSISVRAFDYQAIVGKVLCVGLLDKSGAVVGSMDASR